MAQIVTKLVVELDVEPRHILDVKKDPSAYFQNVMMSCSLDD